MKNIAKKSLLLGAFALLLSTVPVQAIDYLNWSKEALNDKWKSTTKRFNKLSKAVSNCLMGRKSCNRKNIWAARGVATAIAGLLLAAATRLTKPRPSFQYTEGSLPRSESPTGISIEFTTIMTAINEKDTSTLDTIFDRFPTDKAEIEQYFTESELNQIKTALVEAGYAEDSPYYLKTFSALRTHRGW